MKQIRTEIAINAPAEKVWAIFSDLEKFPEWNPLITSAKGELREGAHLDIYMEPPGGKAMGFKTELMTVEPNRELRWVGVFMHKALFTGQHYFLIEPGNEGSVTFVHGEYFGGLMVPFMGGMLRKVEQGFADMNQALKAKVESAG